MPETPPLLSERHMRLKQCRHGPMLYSTKDIYIGRSLDLYGEFSEGEVHFFGQVLQPGMVAIDVGANIGCHTVFMAKRSVPAVPASPWNHSASSIRCCAPMSTSKSS